MISKTTYQPQLTYWVLASISLVILGLFVWDLLGGIELGAVLYLAVSLGTLIWAGNKCLMRLTIDESRFTLYTPFGEETVVDYGQILNVSEEGRLLPTIVVNYHPREESGLLDLDAAKSIILPAMKNQDQLLLILQEKTPA